MKILIIDNGTRRLGRLKELLSNNELTIIKFLNYYPSISEFNLIILSGGSQFAITSAPEIFKEEINLIKTSKKPIIGICEGCQLIAFSYDSDLKYYNKKSKGIRRIIPTKKKDLFGSMEYAEVYESHHWAITELGKDLLGIAKSSTGFEVIKHKNKLIYGLQFHPEMFVDKTLGDDIFIRIFTIIKEATVNHPD